MSRHNKVNPDHYTLAGRLSPDDLAREQRKQSESQFGRGRARARKATPPWLANEQGGGGHRDNNDTHDDLFGGNAEPIGPGNDNEDAEGSADRREPQAGMMNTDGAQAFQGKPRRTAKGKQSRSTAAKPTGQKSAAKKTGRGTVAAGKQATRSTTKSGARSAAKKPAAQRAKQPAARKTASSGTRKTAAKKSTSRPAGRSTAKGSRKTAVAKKSMRTIGSARKTARKRR